MQMQPVLNQTGYILLVCTCGLPDSYKPKYLGLFGQEALGIPTYTMGTMLQPVHTSMVPQVKVRVDYNN